MTTETDDKLAALDARIVDALDAVLAACAYYVSEGYSGLDRRYPAIHTPKIVAAIDAYAGLVALRAQIEVVTEIGCIIKLGDAEGRECAAIPEMTMWVRPEDRRDGKKLKQVPYTQDRWCDRCRKLAELWAKVENE